MSHLALATWASVAVLIAGSVLVFVWFLGEVVREVRTRGEPDADADRDREPTRER